MTVAVSGIIGARRNGRGCSALLRLAICIATAFISTPLLASSSDTAESEAILLQRLTITKVEDLDFGQIIENGGGTVVLSPDPDPSCAPSANIIHSGTCQAAVFGGAGTSGRFVNILVPVGRRIVLTGPGADMEINPVTVSASPDLQYWFRIGRSHIHRIVNPTGIFLFRIGGTLQVGANQTPGLYIGAFDIQVDYY